MWKVVEHDGRRERLAVLTGEQGVWVGWSGGATLLKPKATHAIADKESGAVDAVLAPMTGRIVKVLVNAGDEVTEHQLLLVMEAMKMEYRLTSPQVGTVADVRCKAGDWVDLGASLVTFVQAGA